MRQKLKERRTQFHPGIPMPRMLTMVLMLGIMALIFVRLRDPNTWRMFEHNNDDDVVVAGNEPASGNKPLNSPAAPASSGEKSPPAPNPSPARGRGEVAADSGHAPVAPAQPPAPLGPAVPEAGRTAPSKDPSEAELTPTGPTDLDPHEQDDIQPAISIVSDGSLEMSYLDMPAYFQILDWVDHQPTALLRKRAKKDVLYTNFRKSPDSLRLQIVELKLNVRQIVQLANPPKNGITEPITTREGKPIYEVRGFTQEGGSNLYFGIVTDLPKGMPIGISVNEDARLVGYFFKLQGYISQQQQLEAERTRRRPVTLKAPVIIGRLVWIVAPVAVEEKTPFWLLATIGSVAMVALVGWILLAQRRTRRHNLPAIAAISSLDPDAPLVDNWLDQAQSGRLNLEPVPETTVRSDGAALEGGFGDRLSGNIFRGNDESNNGHTPKHGNSANNGN